MKVKPSIAVAVALLLSGTALFWWLRWDRLPRFRLSDGAEFQVVKIVYTTDSSHDEDHRIGGTPRAYQRLLWQLPYAVAKWAPYPEQGVGIVPSVHPALSIWWARLDPATRLPEIGPAGDVVMTDDSGGLLNLASTPWDPGYRQILVTDLPSGSKHLTFKIPVEGESVTLTIDNPAYHP